MVLVISLVLAAGGFIIWLQSDNSGEIRQASKEQKEALVSGTKQLDGQYIRFDYPATYLSRRIDERGTDLELYQLDANTAYTKKLAISVSDLPDGTLNSNSAYLLRKNRSDMYHQRKVEAGRLTVQVWVSNDATEQTAFITQAGRAAVLAFTQAGGDKDSLTAEVDTILKSFQWK